jgi:hypothetical protein
MALFPPQQPEKTEAAWRQAILKLLRRLNPIRRKRSNPRVVKRKVLKWGAKRDHHTRWPQPGPTLTLQIQAAN